MAGFPAGDPWGFSLDRNGQPFQWDPGRSQIGVSCKVRYTRNSFDIGGEMSTAAHGVRYCTGGLED